MKEFIDIFMNVVKAKYAQFSGRARRKEFWGFQLVGFVISILLAIIDGILGTMSGGIGMLQGIFALALLIPSVALIIRRLHDTDRSGWWALLCVVPLANIALVVLMFLEGTKGTNRFGSDPKALS
ncbi:DUF805 domain-containing protein [Formosimonas limnophila]|nr:DUF805 domain-containing protein [Formosimonas limnophila]